MQQDFSDNKYECMCLHVCVYVKKSVCACLPVCASVWMGGGEGERMCSIAFTDRFFMWLQKIYQFISNLKIFSFILIPWVFPPFSGFIFQQ